ncbi:hypothetical protein [Pseudomonas lactucae]|uniref:hypothetical protein n=1 Tax=Pseudomonas lactucae TaxID=2813360 RepID=UPI002FCCF30A
MQTLNDLRLEYDKLAKTIIMLTGKNTALAEEVKNELRTLLIAQRNLNAVIERLERISTTGPNSKPKFRVIKSPPTTG